MSISNRSPAVVIEYDGRKKRERKTFTDPYAARRFYAAKLNANKNPTLHKESKQ
jgi:hypothetical protein